MTLDNIRRPVIRHVILTWIGHVWIAKICCEQKLLLACLRARSLCITKKSWISMSVLFIPVSSSSSFPSPTPRKKEGKQNRKMNDEKPEQRARANQLVSDEYQLFRKKNLWRTLGRKEFNLEFFVESHTPHTPHTRNSRFNFVLVFPRRLRLFTIALCPVTSVNSAARVDSLRVRGLE